MPADPDSGVRAPGWRLLLGESRMLTERLKAWRTGNDGMADVEGQGQPILIVPGFGATDRSTAILTRRLQACGFAASGWGEGLNRGMSATLRKRLAEKVEALHAETGTKVTLVGWSLGGVFVREMARHLPEHVARVITLGAPFNITPAANNMLPLFRLVNLGRPVNLDWEGFGRRAVAPPVPCTALYSKSDGIVAWQTACEDAGEHTENIEIHGSHFGMPASPQVLQIIAERVAAVRPD